MRRRLGGNNQILAHLSSVLTEKKKKECEPWVPVICLARNCREALCPLLLYYPPSAHLLGSHRESRRVIVRTVNVCVCAHPCVGGGC